MITHIYFLSFKVKYMCRKSLPLLTFDFRQVYANDVRV